MAVGQFVCTRLELEPGGIFYGGGRVDNVPVYGCDTCRGTGGRMNCAIHGGWQSNDYFKRCKNGHQVEGWYKYCPECGEKV